MDCSIDSLKEFLAAPSTYESCIWSWGRPILPPLLTRESRIEMKQYRDQAIQIEARHREKHEKRNCLPSNPMQEASSPVETVATAKTHLGARSIDASCLSKENEAIFNYSDFTGEDVHGSPGNRTHSTTKDQGYLPNSKLQRSVLQNSQSPSEASCYLHQSDCVSLASSSSCQVCARECPSKIPSTPFDKQHEHNNPIELSVSQNPTDPVDFKVTSNLALSRCTLEFVDRLASRNSELLSQRSESHWEDFSTSDDFDRNVTPSTTLDKYMNSQADTLSSSSIQEEADSPHSTSGETVGSWEQSGLHSVPSLVSLSSAVTEASQVSHRSQADAGKEQDKNSMLNGDSNFELQNRLSDDALSVLSSDGSVLLSEHYLSAVSTPREDQCSSAEESTVMAASSDGTEPKTELLAPNHHSTIKPVRRHSFTLDKPSPILLLAHEKCGNAHSSPGSNFGLLMGQCCCSCRCSPHLHGVCSTGQSGENHKPEYATGHDCPLLCMSSKLHPSQMPVADTCKFHHPCEVDVQNTGGVVKSISEGFLASCQEIDIPITLSQSSQPQVSAAESQTPVSATSSEEDRQDNLASDPSLLHNTTELSSMQMQSGPCNDSKGTTIQGLSGLFEQRPFADVSGSLVGPTAGSLALPDSCGWTTEGVKQVIHALQVAQHRWLETVLQQWSKPLQFPHTQDTVSYEKNDNCTSGRVQSSPSRNVASSSPSCASPVSSVTSSMANSIIYNPALYCAMSDEPLSAASSIDQLIKGSRSDSQLLVPAEMSEGNPCTNVSSETNASLGNPVQPTLSRSLHKICLPPEALDPAMKPKFDRMSAAVKGYLTRRLMQTDRVQGIIQTIKDTLLCIIEIDEESPIRENKVTAQDVELHQRLLSQLTTAIYNFHDIFFKLSTAEKMAVIAQSRTKARMKEEKVGVTQLVKQDTAASVNKSQESCVTRSKTAEIRRKSSSVLSNKPKGYSPVAKRSLKQMPRSVDGRVVKLHPHPSGREMTRKTTKCERKSPCPKKDARSPCAKKDVKSPGPKKDARSPGPKKDAKENLGVPSRTKRGIR